MPDAADTGAGGEPQGPVNPPILIAVNQGLITAFDAAAPINDPLATVDIPPPPNPHPIIKAFFDAHPKCSALIVPFDGSGDNGNAWEAFPACNTKTDLSDWKVLEDITLNQDVLVAADQIALAALERQCRDWINNDGGYGHVAIMRHGRVYLSTNIRVTSSENHKARYQLASLCIPTTTP